MTKFSVIMSIYNGSKYLEVKESINSLLTQTKIPNEILINIDGPISNELKSIVNEYSENNFIKFIESIENRGLGYSRDLLIKMVRNNIIAVMDSDDIAVNDRFEIQINKLLNSDLDIVGGLIEEFEHYPGDLKKIRKVEFEHNDIINYSKWRSPMNHVTVMFRKNIYIKAGGYRNIKNVEDYDLFYRMIKEGAKFGNINRVLVLVRSNKNMFLRRKGLNYINSEMRIFIQMYKDNYINLITLIINGLIRLSFRFLPTILLQIIYKLLLRKSG